ncbi:MAG TPA: ribonuclease III [Anaerovoracaceae bacterium]|nr:ribonuclease III [Anaerovoracaceae bacterium]
MNELDFQKIIQYEFQNVNLLKNALTHSSYINEGKWQQTGNNERLEFLGDAILDAVISDYLYRRLDHVEEGELTKLRAVIVCERSLAVCGNRVSIGSYLMLGKGEENSGGRSRCSIIADAMEAVIGAIYLDGGWSTVHNYVIRIFSELIEDAISGRLHMDYKTEIQEKLQSHGEAEICYVIEREEGPDHDKTFYANLVFQGNVIGSGSGRSKKEAEQQAAKQALERGGTFVF